MKAVLFIIRNYDHCNFFLKIGQGQKDQYQQKDLIAKNIHVKFENSSIHCRTVINKI